MVGGFPYHSEDAPRAGTVVVRFPWLRRPCVARRGDMPKLVEKFRSPSRSAPGYTLVDVLISIAIIGLLVTITLPSLQAVRESARRVSCASNLRQLGLATHLYANASKGRLPTTLVNDPRADEISEYVTLSSRVLRYGPGLEAVTADGWDGWGRLFAGEFLAKADRAIAVCPSRRPETDLILQNPESSANPRAIVGDFEYRGQARGGVRRLDAIDARTPLGSDSFGDLGWVNHEFGVNVVTAGVAVHWQNDPPWVSQPRPDGTVDGVPGADANGDENEAFASRQAAMAKSWSTLDQVFGVEHHDWTGEGSGGSGGGPRPGGK